MRVLPLLVMLAACSRGSLPAHPSTDSTETHTTLAAADEPRPAYDTAAIQQALIGERAGEARAERELADAEASGDGDRYRVARDDLAVRRRFIATLELCEAEARMCPPRLDEPALPAALDSDVEPQLDAPLRFDLSSWRVVAGELHGRACACRTLACIDILDVVIGRLEARPMPDVQADEQATESITRARQCLFRLRGKQAVPHIARD